MFGAVLNTLMAEGIPACATAKHTGVEYSVAQDKILRSAVVVWLDKRGEGHWTFTQDEKALTQAHFDKLYEQIKAEYNG
jgi:uncharacterized protein YigE (DUF2233 family)